MNESDWIGGKVNSNGARIGAPSRGAAIIPLLPTHKKTKRVVREGKGIMMNFAILFFFS